MELRFKIFAGSEGVFYGGDAVENDVNYKGEWDYYNPSYTAGDIVKLNGLYYVAKVGVSLLNALPTRYPQCWGLLNVGTAIEEPIGFDSFKSKIERGSEHGISAEVSVDSLGFYGVSAELIRTAYETDIDSELVFIVEMKCSDTDMFSEIYRGSIDLSTYEDEISDSCRVSCKVGEIGVRTTFNNRVETILNLHNGVMKNLDGVDLVSRVIAKEVVMPGKDLLFSSNTSVPENETSIYNDPNDNDYIVYKVPMGNQNISEIKTLNSDTQLIKIGAMSGTGGIGGYTFGYNDAIFVFEKQDGLADITTFTLDYKISCKIYRHLFTSTIRVYHVDKDGNVKAQLNMWNNPEGFSLPFAINLEGSHQITMSLGERIVISFFEKWLHSFDWEMLAGTFFSIKALNRMVDSNCDLALAHETLSRATEVISGLTVKSDWYGRFNSGVNPLIFGRNLIFLPTGWDYLGGFVWNPTTQKLLEDTGNYYNNFESNHLVLEVGNKYTLSLYCSRISGSFVCEIQGRPDGNGAIPYISNALVLGWNIITFLVDRPLTGGLTHYTFRIFGTNSSSSVLCEVSKIKLEIGDIATDWTHMVGGGALKGLVKGLRLRNGDTNRINPTVINSSFKDLYLGLKAIDNIGWGFSEEGGELFIRVENWKWFYKNEVILTIAHPKEMTRKLDEKSVYSRLKIGYAKYAAVEDINSVDTFHTERNYSSGLKAIDHEMSQLCKFVADPYAIEFTRRKSFDKTTKDWKYDENIFVFALKFESDNSWDGFYAVDIGVTGSGDTMISPETMINFRISPFRNACKFTDIVKQGNLTKTYNMTSGVGNVTAKGEPIVAAGYYYLQDPTEQNLVAENDPLYLQNQPILKPETLEFEYPLTVEEYNFVRANPYGKIVVDGEVCYLKKIEYSFIEGLAKFDLVPVV